MRRGGWRRRAENDGWGKWGGYMAAKVQKLEEQFRSDAEMQKDGTSSTIFSGVAIYVNGYTDPSAEELRKLMMLHGGQYHVYYSRSKTTHIIATNLPTAKIKELKGEKVIRPEWIVESIKAGRLLSYIPYQLYSKQSTVQKSLNFNPVCKPEDPVPGPSNGAKQLNNRVNHIIKELETEKEIKANGMNSWNEEDASSDFSFAELEQIFPERKQNGIPPHRDSPAIFNGHTHSSNGALKIQDCWVPVGNSVASRLSPDSTQREEKAENSSTDFRDCSVQLLQQSTRNTDAVRNPHRTNSFSLSSLHTNTKINGAHYSTVQGPSSTKSTSGPTLSKAAPSVPSRPSDCSFISDFYSRSRLHHISTWKCELTEFVNTLQRQSNGIFPGREKLKKMKTGRSALVVTDTGNMSVLSSPRHQSCIMHVDMDCFFVSVGIRNRPDLKGKPVAVTSNRGTGRAPLRPGANPQLEWQYYQNKILKGKADIPDSSLWENQDSAHTNGIDSVLSKAEIASCSYEARQVGIKNGMFFGYAKQLCPNLQAVPYDFHAYKEVARTMYETLASYTHNIEAVSCDEALVDITEILAETKLTPDEFASAVRMEIKDQTHCAASVGIGSNILLARMATRKAKPDGQYHLKPEEVDDFIRGQLVTNLPEHLEMLAVLQSDPASSSPACRQGATMSPLSWLSTRVCQCPEAEIPVGAGSSSGPVKSYFCPYRTVTLDQATDSAKVIGKATLNMFHTLKLNISDMRGVGIQVNQLVPAHLRLHACPRHVPAQPDPGGSHSVLDLLQVQKAKTSSEEEHQEVFLAAMDLEITSASRTCTFLPSLSTHLTSAVSPVTSKAEPSGKWNGLHSPISLKSKLNLSIEVPSPSQLDQSVLEALPPDLREQVEQVCAVQQGEQHGDKKNEPVNGCNTGIVPQPVGTVLLQIPEPQASNNDMGINVIALPAFSQVDPEVFAALPAELQKELKAAYDQRQRQGESSAHQQAASTAVPKNPLLQLKPASVKEKKRNKKKNPISSPKKVQSPLKNKLLNSPAKAAPGASGSPQKLIEGFLKHEGPTPGKPLGELSASTSGVQPSPSGCVRPPAPNLAGAVEFSDVKTLLKEWITTISDPMEEDILQVVKYCTDLIEEKDLEKLDLVIKYMKRLTQQSVESVWNMAFDFILDNVQVVLQQTYGSTLKVT
ncbi:PREDICTED: DNA repair protein REV1 [Myotis brandtii]|uniref:DNA repair protein REV1 n=1 Tax=Myotis brandtii TaxID=109478 RepID=UPI0007046C46|nr:PREDICTED: DNA repair protein REV1 [Myotis brandtii]